jgi:hypothetical protein
MKNRWWGKGRERNGRKRGKREGEKREEKGGKG